MEIADKKNHFPVWDRTLHFQCPYLPTLPDFPVFYQKTPPATGIPEIFDFYQIQQNQRKHRFSACFRPRGRVQPAFLSPTAVESTLAESDSAVWL